MQKERERSLPFNEMPEYWFERRVLDHGDEFRKIQHSVPVLVGSLVDLLDHVVWNVFRVLPAFDEVPQLGQVDAAIVVSVILKKQSDCSLILIH